MEDISLEKAGARFQSSGLKLCFTQAVVVACLPKNPAFLGVSFSGIRNWLNLKVIACLEISSLQIASSLVHLTHNPMLTFFLIKQNSAIRRHTE